MDGNQVEFQHITVLKAEEVDDFLLSYNTLGILTCISSSNMMPRDMTSSGVRIFYKKIIDLDDTSKPRDPAAASARHVILKMQSFGQNKDCGISTGRNHTTLISKAKAAPLLPTKVVKAPDGNAHRKLVKVDVETDESGITCPVHMSCSKFEDMTTLIKHIVDGIINQPECLRKCTFCDFQLTNPNKTWTKCRIHMEKHLNQPKFACPALECDMKFRSARDLNRHITDSHDDNIELQVCNQCDPPKPSNESSIFRSMSKCTTDMGWTCRMLKMW